MVPAGDVLWTIVIVLGQFASVGVFAFLAQRRASRLFQSDPESSNAAQQFHHRASSLLRVLLGIGCAITVFLTRWPEWFDVTDSAIDPRNFNHGIGKDSIPAIDDPKFLAAADPKLAEHNITGDTTVIGYAEGGIAKAYPIKILDRHEIVNDWFGDKPIAVGW